MECAASANTLSALHLKILAMCIVHHASDLRWRAVWLVLLCKMSYNEAGDILFMSERSVRRYVDQYQSTGDVEPRKHRYGPEKMLTEAMI